MPAVKVSHLHQVPLTMTCNRKVLQPNSKLLQHLLS